jgi:hypothetical protein
LWCISDYFSYNENTCLIFLLNNVNIFPYVLLDIRAKQISIWHLHHWQSHWGAQRKDGTMQCVFPIALDTSALEEHRGHEFAAVKADFNLSIWAGGTGLGVGGHHQFVGSCLLSLQFLALSHQGQMDFISGIYKHLNNTLFHPA